MSITTKTGDKGQTSLYSGQRVWKDELRVEAYGTLDELDAFVGDACHHVDDDKLVGHLRGIQNLLYRAMGQLATIQQEYQHPICPKDVESVTTLIHELEKETPLKGFVIPGACVSSARLDICRTIARRAERRLIALNRKEAVDEQLMMLVNRLSDLFFIMARYLEHRAGKINYKTNPDIPGCEGEIK
ncbi:MAG: cob(I)yrinic acid a,c-diamide adenosyltransferase [Candidatus Cloacimonetes bacterium]|nr:cob(I)yrinic acid a,c-diamide adenosyltransferase [Candidatus Cloacimonadota bacterium]